MSELRTNIKTGENSVVFPGQGSQRLGMGQDFIEAFPEARLLFQQASEVLGYDLAALCMEDESRLSLTQFTQPAILTLETAVFNIVRERYGFTPYYFAGHSLGEYTALVAAGVMQFDVALKIVAERASLMQHALEEGQGSMLALIADKLPFDKIEDLSLQNTCEIANYNSHQQLVVSGYRAAIERFRADVARLLPEIRVVPLNVSAPFHCSLMSKIEKQFEAVLEAYRFHFDLDKARKVLSNYTGAFHTQLSLCSSLVKQISAPVRWIENMIWLSRSSKEILEIGPQRILSKFFLTLDRSVSCVSDMRSLSRTFGGKALHAI